MKIFLLVLATLCLSANSHSQKTETRLDAAFRPTSETARFIQLTELKNALYFHETFYEPEKTVARRFSSSDAEGKIIEGEFSEYYVDGKIKTKATYNGGKKDGEYLRYYPEGTMKEKAYYSNGSRKGTNFTYHTNGVVADSLIGDGQGAGREFHFYESGIRMSEGEWINDTSKHNTWTYYNQKGQQLAIEKNDHGKVKSVSCFDTKGNPLPESACQQKEASYMQNESDWRKYLGSFINPEVPVRKNAPVGKYTVMVQFVVSTDGRLKDITPLTSFGYGMEEEVMRAIRKSPRWNPALMYGQPINAYRRQPITFEVQDDKKKNKKSS